MSDESFSWLQTDPSNRRRHKGGLNPAELLDMAEETRELMTYIMRREPVAPAAVAEALKRDVAEVTGRLQLLAVQGWLEVERQDDEQLYRVRLTRRRRRALPPGIWQVLEDRWQVPVFRIFSEGLVEDFIRRFALRRYAPDEYLFRAGEWGDTMFVVDEGTVELLARSLDGDEIVVEQVRPGGVVGEMGVLLGEKRPFGARARDEVQAWVLSKTDFDHLLAVDPEAALVLRHELRRSLRKPGEKAAKPFNPAVVAGRGVHEIGRHLADVTGREVSILDLRPRQTAGDETGSPRVSHRAVADISGRDLRRELALRLDAGDWALLAVSTELNGALLSVMDQMEVVLDLTGQDLPWLIAASRRRWAVPPAQANYERLARRLAGRTVGLALSGGMARGLAHIGVLRALKEAAIPVDMIAGSGMGAVCGGLYAAGIPLDRLERLALEGKLNPLAQPSWHQRLTTRAAPYDNRSACETIAEVLGDRDVAELSTPFLAVATDLTSGQAVMLNEGRLAEVLSVALSPPGLTPPVALKGHLLADGAPLNPLPTDCLERQGANLILASSVIPGQATPNRRSDPLPGAQDLAGSLLGLYDALAQSVYLDRLSLAGLLLTPAVGPFADTAFEQAREIIYCGQESVRQQLSQIRHWIGI